MNLQAFNRDEMPLPDKPKQVRRRDPSKMARSKRSERKVARHFGGARRPASGAISGLPGDVKTDTYLIEVKFTDKPSYLVTRRVLEKIYFEALPEGRMPMLSIYFRRENRRFILVPYEGSIVDADKVIHGKGSFVLHARSFSTYDVIIVSFEWAGIPTLWRLEES